MRKRLRRLVKNFRSYLNIKIINHTAIYTDFLRGIFLTHLWIAEKYEIASPIVYKKYTAVYTDIPLVHRNCFELLRGYFFSENPKLQIA